jgi:hypothetical protein
MVQIVTLIIFWSQTFSAKRPRSEEPISLHRLVPAAMNVNIFTYLLSPLLLFRCLSKTVFVKRLSSSLSTYSVKSVGLKLIQNISATWNELFLLPEHKNEQRAQCRNEDKKLGVVWVLTQVLKIQKQVYSKWSNHAKKFYVAHISVHEILARKLCVRNFHDNIFRT